LADVTEEKVLLFIESGAVSKRMQEFYIKPIRIKDAGTLLDIYKYLFQDIYAWAGKTTRFRYCTKRSPSYFYLYLKISNLEYSL
jgi:fido (protein-threonine AMPylation protein)